MGFKSRADQISHALPTTRSRSNLDVWALAQSRGYVRWPISAKHKTKFFELQNMIFQLKYIYSSAQNSILVAKYLFQLKNI